jgi:hypothetical protein
VRGRTQGRFYTLNCFHQFHLSNYQMGKRTPWFRFAGICDDCFHRNLKPWLIKNAPKVQKSNRNPVFTVESGKLENEEKNT